MPRAGLYRHRGIIREFNTGTTADTYGVKDVSILTNWTTVSTRWMAIEPTRGTERFEGQQLNPETTMVVKMRYYNKLTADMQIAYPKEWTTLGAAISTTDGTSVTLSAAFNPGDTATNYLILCESELMLVTAGHTTTALTVTRGVCGTTGAIHANATKIARMSILEILGISDLYGRHEQLFVECKEWGAG